jgi:arabinogalactan endo-1,4-beta-galactosidase
MSLLPPAALVPACTGTTPGGTPFASAGPTLPAIRGADLSFLLQQEATGSTFRDGGPDQPVERLLAARGANLVRVRAWVDPPRGYSDLGSALTLARRAHASGQGVLLDLHYSDFWADRFNQATPTSWASQDLSELTATVRSYTRGAVAAFAEQGTPVQTVQIGNEVTCGMLWPLGQVYGDRHEHWDGFVQLLRAGLDGAREAATGPLHTMIHIDRGGDQGGARYFFDHVVEAGVDFDLIGLSYYPFWHGPLVSLQQTLGDLAIRYGRDIVVVETSYPWVLPTGDGVTYHAARADQLPDGYRFPATPQGQAAYFEALRGVLQQVPGSRGLGFVAWEPAWLPGVGWADGEDNPFGNLTMFDRQGNGLPSLAAFRP